MTGKDSCVSPKENISGTTLPAPIRALCGDRSAGRRPRGAGAISASHLFLVHLNWRARRGSFGRNSRRGTAARGLRALDEWAASTRVLRLSPFTSWPVYHLLPPPR